MFYHGYRLGYPPDQLLDLTPQPQKHSPHRGPHKHKNTHPHIVAVVFLALYYTHVHMHVHTRTHAHTHLIAVVSLAFMRIEEKISRDQLCVCVRSE